MTVVRGFCRSFELPRALNEIGDVLHFSCLLQITEFFFYSDDEQRTIMSGQVSVGRERWPSSRQIMSKGKHVPLAQWQILLNHFIPPSNESEAIPIIPWNSGDFNVDALYPNPLRCPRLQSVSCSGTCQTNENERDRKHVKWCDTLPLCSSRNSLLMRKRTVMGFTCHWANFHYRSMTKRKLETGPMPNWVLLYGRDRL